MTLHVLPDLGQGSEEWHDQRRGIVTASAVGRLVTARPLGAIEYPCPECDAAAGGLCLSKRAGATSVAIKTLHSSRTAIAKRKGAPTVITPADGEDARNFTLLLAAERVTGWTEDTPMTSDMWRGVEMEPIARSAYAEHFGVTVDEVGFMRRDEADWQLGFSPDGLVGGDGAIEIKAPRAKTHLLTILADEVPAHYMPQCQAGLLVSGREWIDFVSYVGGMPLFVKRVYPDPRWFDAITAACIAFEANVAQIVADYRERTADMPQTERTDFEIKVA